MEIVKSIKLSIDTKEWIHTGLNYDTIFAKDKSEYLTTICFTLPRYQQEYPIGSHKRDYDGSYVEITIEKIFTKSQDVVFNYAKASGMNVSGDDLPVLPIEIYLDNRRKYPCFQLIINVPYRLAEERDPTKDGVNQSDLEEFQITGENPYIRKVKIAALKELNNFFSEVKFEKKVTIDEVTAFVVIYSDKKTKQPICKKVLLLTTKDAFKNAISDYYLGPDNHQHLLNIANRLPPSEISTEEDLFKVIISTINEIAHYIEQRRWYGPFWDEKRPKAERDIQPTFHVLFEILLNPRGIHASRETNEGIGDLDFKFMYTNTTNTPLKVLAELKLAHNQRMKEGLTTQLPAYLKSDRSKFGIFVVMWFKDDNKKFFKKPQKYDKTQLIACLKKESDIINGDGEIMIKPIVIDASKKPSASQL